MKEFIKSLPERKIISSGHTLSLLEVDDKLFAYKGEVNFKGISLYVGDDINSLQPKGQILKNRRWAVSIVDNDIVYLFCTYHKNYKPDIFKYQDIYCYSSNDGILFETLGIFTTGSAPCIWKHAGTFFLYYHRKTDNSHDILLRMSPSVLELKDSPEIKVISIPITNKNEALSAPSIFKKADIFYMLCEYRTGSNQWSTVLYKSNSPIEFFKYEGVVLDNNRACAFQHLINDKYILTYSVKINNIWGICLKGDNI